MSTSNDIKSAFRQAMSAVCTPVSVVTSYIDGLPYGTTVSAFSSLSMDPPMILVSLDRASLLLETLQLGSEFGLNVLAETQSAVALRFATKAGTGKFAELDWFLHGGVPRLPEVGVFVACRVADLVPGGDHVIVLGDVLTVDSAESAPLTYHSRKFGTHAAATGKLMTPATCAESVQRAVAALAAGRMVVVIDDVDREDEGDLVAAAELITERQMAFLVRHTTGIVCAPMPAARADALQLPPMVAVNNDAHSTAFTVSVDGAGTGTEVSAAARSVTVRALAAQTTHPESLRRPGHVFPLRARDGGVLTRAGHTEAAVDLLQLAGLSGVGVISELVNDEGSMQTRSQLLEFADRHDLPVLDIADLVRYRRASEQLVEPVAAASLPV